jgi:hypothetical protein
MSWAVPSDQFFWVKYYAVEIVSTIIFVMWLVKSLIHELGFKMRTKTERQSRR